MGRTRRAKGTYHKMTAYVPERLHDALLHEALDRHMSLGELIEEAFGKRIVKLIDHKPLEPVLADPVGPT